MKHFFFIAGTFVLLTACNSTPQSKPEQSKTQSEDSLRMAADTTGLSEYQQWKAQNELSEQNKDGDQRAEKAAASHSSTHKTSAHRTTTGSSAAAAPSESGSASSGSGNSAQAKKGWSKTAKGAVIGGVAGAGAGAIINKKNRVAGAVIGGAVGAGAGAIIGNQMDKKDGRH